MMVARALPLLLPLAFSLLLALWPAAQAKGAVVLPPLPVGWQTKMAALLPMPGEVATIRQMRPSISTVQLSLRVQAAGGSPEALQQVVVTASKGVVPTYDERLGISPQQFRSYLVFQDVLAYTGKTVKLAVVRDSRRLLFGDAPGLNGILKGVSIDLKTGELRGPEGFTAKPAPVPPNVSADRTLNIQSGFQWRMRGNNGSLGNGVNATLNLLELADGEVVLQYIRTSMIARVLTGPHEIIVSYSR